MEDDTFPTVVAHYSFEFSTICVVDDYLVPTTFALRIDMFPNQTSDPADIELSLTKAQYWTDLVSKSIVANVSNKRSVALLIDDKTHSPRVSNSIMLLPDDPDEETIAKVFQAKFNALANQHIMFSVVEIEADHGNGVGFAYLGTAVDELPEMTEWVGTGNWFDKPWWARNDASMIDTAPQEGDDLTKTPSWAYSLDFLGDKPETPKTVKVVAGNFKPKVINGGGEKPK